MLPVSGLVSVSVCLLMLFGCKRAPEEHPARTSSNTATVAKVRNLLSCGEQCPTTANQADLIRGPSASRAGVVAPTLDRRLKQGSTSVASVMVQDAGVIPVLFSSSESADYRLAADLVRVLDNNTLRVLPVIGGGPHQTIHDLLHLPGIDLGVVQMDALESLSGATRTAARKRLRYIARLYSEELHVIAGRDIKDLRQLDGHRVSIGSPGSASSITGRRVFEKLGIRPVLMEIDQAIALDRLRSGTIDAAVHVAAKPDLLISGFADDRFHLVPIPYEGELADAYLPGQFDTGEYPNLIGAPTPVHTIAVGTVLAVVAWPKGTRRYLRAARFTEALYSQFPELHKQGRHPKWRDVSPAAIMPDWERYAPAEDFLGKLKAGVLRGAS